MDFSYIHQNVIKRTIRLNCDPVTSWYSHYNDALLIDTILVVHVVFCCRSIASYKQPIRPSEEDNSDNEHAINRALLWCAIL